VDSFQHIVRYPIIQTTPPSKATNFIIISSCPLLDYKMGGAKCMKKKIPNAFVWAIVYQQNIELI
jgi:hypothetical protein